ncbi:hypothetical protein [Massilia sp. 9096]|uniref:hypothetical protein n=1 Tax=Massilia sp. 9096 TaxID=1500894 RepID=UPI00068D146C|nr:hypothetical protein [Massilia sp. 9096]
MRTTLRDGLAPGRGKVGPKTDEAADAQFDKDLDAALTRKPSPMATKKSKVDGEAFMLESRAGSAAALASRIERKELITSAELQDALKIRRQSVSEAVKSHRLLALVGPSGENYYPTFYADPDFDRRALEKVTKSLGALPGASKYSFFTTKSNVLGTTPLGALRQGRLVDVLNAAAAFGDR